MASTSTQATRLAELRRNSGLTLEEVAAQLKKVDAAAARSYGAIARYEKDDTIRLNLKTLNGLAKIYKTTPEYIEKGNSTVSAGEAGGKYSGTISNARLRPPVEEVGEPLYLPRIRVRARASFAETFGTDADFADYDLSLIQNPTPEMRKDGSIEMEIDGDSMEPTLHSGWFIACTPIAQADFKYISSGVYAIVFTNHFVVKRIKDNDLNRNGTLTLHSDNLNAGTQTIDGADIRAIWRVVRITEGKVS